MKFDEHMRGGFTILYSDYGFVIWSVILSVPSS